MEKKASSIFCLFKRLNRIGSGKCLAGLRWKRRFTLHLWFIDGVLFKVVSVFEAIFLASTLCFFFLCCGCHF